MTRAADSVAVAIVAPSITRTTAVLAIVLVSYLMIVVDISIVITGLPRMQQGLQFSPTGLSWVQNAYTLAFGGLLLLGARAGDILGRRRMFIVGLAVFTAASLAVGAAQSAWWLIAARVVQGVGAAILAPSTLALLTTNFREGPERTRALAYYAATAGVGASIGLVLGGVIADLISWRVGFFINVPIGIGLILAARRYVPESARRSGQLDIVGAFCSTLGMSALVYGIVRSASAGWSAPVTLVPLSAGVVLLVLLVLNERRAAQPVMPLRLFASSERAGAYLARVLYLGAMSGFWFFITQYLQGVLGYGPLGAGIAFLPTTLPNFAAAMLVPRLTRQFGNARVLGAALALTLIGMAWLSRVGPESSYWAGVALPMILIGLGQGMALGPLTVAGVAGVAPDDAGAASGVVNVAHQLGASFGLAVLVAVSAMVGFDSPDAHALLAHRVSVALTAATVMLAVALCVVLALIVRWRSRIRD